MNLTTVPILLKPPRFALLESVQAKNERRRIEVACAGMCLLLANHLTEVLRVGSVDDMAPPVRALVSKDSPVGGNLNPYRRRPQRLIDDLRAVRLPTLEALLIPSTLPTAGWATVLHMAEAAGVVDWSEADEHVHYALLVGAFAEGWSGPVSTAYNATAQAVAGR